MKIAKITTNWGRGGPGGVVKDLYEEFSAVGDDCLVCYGRGSIPENIAGCRIGSIADNVSHLVKSRLFDEAGFGSKTATKAFLKRLEAFRPDVIHLHNLLGYYIDCGELFSFLKSSGIPVVWTLHDCWAFTGHCINCEAASCEKWQSGCFECPLKNEYPECILKDRSERNYARKKELFNSIPDITFVTPSEWLKGLACRSFLKDHEFLTIPNGIDTEKFRCTPSDIRERYSLENKTILLCVAGVWSRMKGLYLANEIADAVDDSCRVVLIGDTGKLPVSERILHIERTENTAELVKWYSAADMLLNPTFGDNFPTVNLEALNCGTPVVTNATGGSPEAAGNEAGKIVYSKSAEEFLQRISECKAEHYDRSYIRSFGEKYDRHICAGRYHSLLESKTESK